LLIALVIAITPSLQAQPSMQTIFTNGPTSNRLNIVVLSEGYTSGQLGQFFLDASNAVRVLLTHPPYHEYSNYVNAFAIKVASAQPGSDHPAYGVTVNTYFNSTYDGDWDYYITIPLGSTGQGKVDSLLQTYMPKCQLSILLVNDLTQGGSDGFDQTAIASTGAVAAEAPPTPPGILTHATGHVLGNLGDEYTTPYPGFPDTEEPNTTQQTNRSLIKWRAWIDPSTPVPTPSYDGDGVVGLFEGAHYHETGWYRPQLICAMGSLGVPFCAVCSEALVLAIYQKVRPVDAFTPASSTLSVSNNQALTFNLTRLQPASHNLDIQWFTNGISWSGATNPSLNLLPEILPAGTNRISALVRDATALVRNDPTNLLSQTITWSLMIQSDNPPSITVQPQSQTNIATTTASFTVAADGTPPLRYQWFKWETNAIAGATNDTYKVIGVQGSDSGNYSVVVSNMLGSVTSSVATLTVVFPPSITQEPQSCIVAAGTTLHLTVTFSGSDPLSYQWVNSSGTIWGATNATYSLNPVRMTNADSYFVIGTNAYGSVTSSVATVTVYVPVNISTQPASQVVSAHSTVLFGVVAEGYPAPAYQWAFNGTNLPGATAETLTLTNVLMAKLGDYSVLVGNGYSSLLSTPATLSMSPSITSPFLGATTTWGKSAIMSVGAMGSGDLGYQWYQDGLLVAGGTNATLNFPSIQFTNGGLYSVVVRSLFGSITNVAAQVIVNPAGLSLGFSPTLTIGGVAGYSYVIQSSTNLADTNAWVTLTNLTLTQPVELWVDTSVDASTPFYTKYYYRVLPGQ
jgi:hypothetical protein